MIFAFGRDGSVPRWFAHVHSRFRTPDVAILTYAVIAFIISVSGTFATLAVLSNVAVLLMYVLCCAGSLVLIQRDVRSEGEPITFADPINGVNGPRGCRRHDRARAPGLVSATRAPGRTACFVQYS